MNKQTSKSKAKEFDCGYCEAGFIGIPYAVVEFPSSKEKHNFCNAGCWKEFIRREIEKMEDEIDDEVLMTNEAIAFQALLESRVDYKEILQSLKETLDGYREEFQENVARNKDSD